MVAEEVATVEEVEVVVIVEVETFSCKHYQYLWDSIKESKFAGFLINFCFSNWTSLLNINPYPGLQKESLTNKKSQDPSFLQANEVILINTLVLNNPLCLLSTFSPILFPGPLISGFIAPYREDKSAFTSWT